MDAVEDPASIGPELAAAVEFAVCGARAVRPPSAAPPLPPTTASGIPEESEAAIVNVAGLPAVPPITRAP